MKKHLGEAGRVPKNSQGKFKPSRAKTRALLAEMKKAMNDGGIPNELEIRYENHFRTLYKFRRKS